MSQHHRNKSLPRWAWQRLRTAIFNRDGWQCVFCQSRYRLECDHIVGLADGGGNEPANLRTVCRGCHLKRSGHAHRVHHVNGQDDWAAALRGKGKRNAEL